MSNPHPDCWHGIQSGAAHFFSGGWFLLYFPINHICLDNVFSVSVIISCKIPCEFDATSAFFPLTRPQEVKVLALTQAGVKGYPQWMESCERGGSDQDVSRHLAPPLGQTQDLGYVLHQKFCGHKPQKVVADNLLSNTAALLSHYLEVYGGVRSNIKEKCFI